MHMAKKKLKDGREKDKPLKEQQGEKSEDGAGDRGDKSKPSDDPLSRKRVEYKGKAPMKSVTSKQCFDRNSWIFCDFF